MLVQYRSLCQTSERRTVDVLVAEPYALLQGRLLSLKIPKTLTMNK